MLNQQQLFSMSASETNDIQNRYSSGTRDFEREDLSNIDLKGIDLSFANLRGANLSGSDLSQAILKGVDLQGANLKRAKLDRAILQGANLGEAQIIWGSLINADLNGADLHKATLDAASLEEATLQGTDLSGACLLGTDLKGAVLRRAIYSDRTRFASDFNPIAAGMQLEVKLAVEDLLVNINRLSELSENYLGSMLTAKNWKAARPPLDWLNNFEVINRPARLAYAGMTIEPLELLQVKQLQLWVNDFIKSCSQIISDLPVLIEDKQIVFALLAIEPSDSQYL